MSQFIIIQVGQCGNQIGSCFISQMLLESNISFHSNRTTTKVKKPSEHNLTSFMHFGKSTGDSHPSTVDELIKNKAKARVICIDMEDSVVARFKTGPYRHLYEPGNFITNYPGSGNNWAEGFCLHGPNFRDKILQVVQANVDKCESLHGFLLLFSVGGGTGSGLGTFTLQLLAENYPKIDRFVVCVYPIGTEDVVTCPYNMALASEQLLEYATCVFPAENRALMEIVKRQTNRYDCDSDKDNRGSLLLYGNRTFDDLNCIVVDMILHLTSGARFSGCLNLDMNEINTNMVPFPRLSFLASGFSPMFSKVSSSKQQKKEAFVTATSRNNQLLKIDPFDPKQKVLSATLLGRGTYTLDDMRDYVKILNTSKIHNLHPPWSKKTIKVALCQVAPQGLDIAMLSLINTTGMATLFKTVAMQFKKLYDRKAHVHHYTNLTEFNVDQFRDCQNSLDEIIELYLDTGNLKASYNQSFLNCSNGQVL